MIYCISSKARLVRNLPHNLSVEALYSLSEFAGTAVTVCGCPPSVPWSAPAAYMTLTIPHCPLVFA